uniref:Anaphase-promoting complex subunit 4 WD40 domain-containing protein n=1 Tax=Ciona savignyi TaxID=51511 RepID=H2Y8F9_CIOSA
MNFSELFNQTQSLVRFSPDGNYLANCVSYKVIIRAVETLQILRLYTCMDAVQSLEWSSDSQFLLCAMYKRGLVQVWSVEQPDWTCKIDEGSAGLIHAQWSPDGRHVLTTASFNLRITVWSLVNKSISYIRYIKNSKDCLSFSSSGKYLAVGESRKCKDFISVFDVESWQLLKLFETDTEDLSGIKWSPDSRVICAWEHCLCTFKAYDWALGVKRIEWSPASQFLAVGSYDQKVRVLNYITWKSISEFSHTPSVNTNDAVVFEEVNAAAKVNATLESTKKPSELFSTQSKYQICETPLELPFVKPDPQKPNPKIGISWLAFSSDNRYLATIDDSMKSALHIWTMKTLSLFVIIKQLEPIKCARWNPRLCRLAYCCGNNKIYLWAPSGAVSVQIPLASLFHTHSLRWHPDGGSLVLASKEQMC